MQFIVYTDLRTLVCMRVRYKPLINQKGVYSNPFNSTPEYSPVTDNALFLSPQSRGDGVSLTVSVSVWLSSQPLLLHHSA